MAKITAYGTIHGLKCEVTCTEQAGKLEILFWGDSDPDLEEDFRAELAKGHAMAGTFYPPENSLLNALNVLQYHFFDAEPKISVDGDIGEIPYETDTLY